ncbi:DUF3265 domain-containing protein [Vibrio vulnificus]|nr:DUF3265 domain-containing protein [Vibrio vulnificus]
MWHAWHFQYALSSVVTALCGSFCIACLHPLTRRYMQAEEICLIFEAMSYAESHALKASSILNEKGLAEALEYCRQQGIDPPQCSLTAKSANAENLRNKAKRMISEVKWWSRRLERKAVQNFEHIQRQNGKVTNIISDESLEYQRRKARR